MDDPLDSLSDGERKCLRLVLRNLTSKEIAQELGLSPHTVDNRLKSAMRTLEVSSRRQAARLLAAASNDEPTDQELADQLLDVDPGPSHAAASSLPDVPGRITGEEDSDDTGTPLDDAPARFAPRHPRKKFVVPRWSGGVRTKTDRIISMFGVSLVSALAFGAILAGLHALGDIF